MDEKKAQQILAIVKAIAYAENGGKPSEPKAGATGEMKSIFQFTPGTWKQYSKEAFGKELPMNTENESAVVFHKVQKWVDDGYNVQQIASMWNAGEGRPDAYKQNWKGVNKQYGVSYDTPAYAEKVFNYAKDFGGVEGEQGSLDNEPSKPVKGGSASQSQPQSLEDDIQQRVAKVRSMIDSTKSASTSTNMITPPSTPAPSPQQYQQPGGGALGGLGGAMQSKPQTGLLPQLLKSNSMKQPAQVRQV